MSGRCLCLIGGVLLYTVGLGEAASPVENPPAAAAGVDVHGDPLPVGARARLGTIRFRHGAMVYRLAASSDGKRLATLGIDRYIRLWDAEDGREVRSMQFFNVDGTQSFAFSPNGKMLLAADGNTSIHLWDAATGDAIKTFENVNVGVASAGWSHDGKMIVTTDNTEVMRVWDVATGKELRQLKWAPPKKAVKEDGDKGILGLIRWYANKLNEMEEANAGGGQVVYNASTAVFSPDGKHLTAWGGLLENGQINRMHFRTWEVATWKPSHAWTVLGAGGQPRLAYSPDSKVVAATDAQEAVCLFDARTGKELHTLGTATTAGFTFSSDSKTVAVADHGNTIRLFSVESGKEQRVLTGAGLGQMTLAMLPDGRRLATAGANNQVQFWDLTTGKPVRTIEGHTGAVLSAVLSADGKSVITRGADGSVRFWDRAGRHLRIITPLESTDLLPQVGAVTRDGRRFAIGSAELDVMNGGGFVNAHVRVFDLESGKETLNVPFGHNAPAALAFSNDGRRLAAAIATGTQIWDLQSGKQIRHFAAEAPRGEDEPMDEPGPVATILAFSPDDRVLACVGPNAQTAMAGLAGFAAPPGIFEHEPYTVTLWEVASGKKRSEFAIETEPDSFEPNVLFDDKGRPIQGASTGRGPVLRFAPRGKHLLLGSGSSVYLFDVTAGKEVRRFGGNRLHAPSADFSPDGKLLAAGTREGWICVWDVATGTTLSRTAGHRSAVNAVAFSRDGRSLTSASADTTGLVWDVASLLARRDSAPAALPPQRLQSLWQQLGNAEAAQAETAMRGLSAVPADTVPFLGRQLKPQVVKVTSADIERFIKELDGATFASREKAMRDLERLERAAEIELRKAFAEPQTSLEVRRRMERLLERLDAPIIDAERLRELRAIEVLEDIGTSEAKQVLERLATGTPGLTLTREAKSALVRLKR